MTHMEEKLLTQWNLHSAVHLNSFTINRGESTLLIEVEKTYLFAHPGIRNTTHATLDQLWKGLVVEIRRTPSQKDALLKVIWFWAKTDIENAVKEKSICSDLTLLLESMAKNELCVGSEGVINSSDAVSCDASVVYLESEQEKLHTQEPIVEYFFRMAWDEKDQVMKTDPPGCSKASCTLAWNPDQHEQRYCDACKKWYHTFCLRYAHNYDQSTIRDQAMSVLSLPPLPLSLYDVAYQPIARGGGIHFTAGNIRIVMKARGLVTNPAERSEVTKGLEWGEEEWIKFLNLEFGLQEGNDVNEERLLIKGQKIYNCPCSILV